MGRGVRVGDELPAVVMQPSEVQLFRYSAVTWNSHRLHFDRGWAQREGYDGVLVQSHLHAANALRPVTDGLGPGWRVSRFGYRIVHTAVSGDVLTATARVVGVEDGRVELVVEERNQRGDVCLEGRVEAVVWGSGESAG